MERKICALKLTTTQANSPPLPSVGDKTANITYSPDTDPIKKKNVQYVEYRYGQQIFIFLKISRPARWPFKTPTQWVLRFFPGGKEDGT